MTAAPGYFAQLDFYDQVEYGILQPMIAWLCDGQPLRVLDAGCGEGAPALIFAKQGCGVVGSILTRYRSIKRGIYWDRLHLGSRSSSGWRTYCACPLKLPPLIWFEQRRAASHRR